MLDKMLNKNGAPEPIRRDRPEPNRGEIKAFLGEGTNFKGVLAFEGTVRIDGKLEGEIVTNDTLVIGERAIINAELNVGCVSISGKVTGDIIAKERIDIHSSGEVYGNIISPILTIEEGVIFHGNCDMRKPEEYKTPQLVNKTDSADGKLKDAPRKLPNLLEEGVIGNK